MSDAAETTTLAGTGSDMSSDNPDHSVEQLSLLPASEAPLRFRLDAHTRQLGLVQVAKMRAVLKDRIAARTGDATGEHLRRLRPPEIIRDRAA